MTGACHASAGTRKRPGSSTWHWFSWPEIVDHTDDAPEQILRYRFGRNEPNRSDEKPISIVPNVKNQAYRMRRIIESVVDQGSFFEMGKLFGRSIVTGFAWLDGWPVAIMAGDPLFEGGAWTADTCNKIIRFVDMAQTFHLPIVHLGDCPGFQVGLRAESSAVIRWGVRALSAIKQTTVPWCSVVVLNCHGVGGLGHQPVGRLALRYAWPSASWGSLPLEGGD